LAFGLLRTLVSPMRSHYVTPITHTKNGDNRFTSQLINS